MKRVFGKIYEKFNISGRDAKIFVISLLLASGIWLIHNLSLNYSEIIRIPVSAQCDITGHYSESSNSSMVLARCHTSGFALLALENAYRRKPLKVRFNLSDMHMKGGEMYYVTADDLNRYLNQIFGSGTRVETFISDTLMFRFPYENHKKVPVQAVYSIGYRPQYINVGNLKLIPDSVTVYGEPFHLDDIGKVFTEPITLENLSASVHGEVRLDKIKGIRISDETVRYNMDVSRYVEIKTSLPVETVNVPKGISLIVYPSRANVLFRCAFPVSSDPAADARVYVDYNEFAGSLEGQCLPHLDSLPSGVLNYVIEPVVFDCVESGR